MTVYSLSMSSMSTHTHSRTHLHINTHAQCECNPLNRSGNFTAAVGAGDQDDAWTEAVSPQRKASTYANVHTHNTTVLIKGISTMCMADRKE